MIAFLLRRSLLLIALFLIFSFVLWFIGTPEGYPTLRLVGLQSLAPNHFLAWFSQELQGNFGYSLLSHEPVNKLFSDALLPSLLIIIPAFLLQEVLAIPLGMLAAVKWNTLLDKWISMGMFTLASLPAFWLGLMGIVWLCVNIRLFTFNGIVDIAYTGTGFGTTLYWTFFRAHVLPETLDLLRHLTLPILIVALGNAAGDGQFLRTAMLDVLNQEYMRHARARGLPRRVILWKHGFRNAAIPLITSFALQFPRFVVTVSIAEYIFGIPGLGGTFIHGIQPVAGRLASCHCFVTYAVDLPVITGYVFLIGIITFASSLLADIAYALVDPRVRIEV